MTADPPPPLPGPPPDRDENFYRILLEQAGSTLILADDGTVRYATPAASELLGRNPEGTRFPGLLADAAGHDAARAAARMLAAPGPAAEEWRITGPAGRQSDVEARVTDHRATPAIGGLVLTLKDITRQRDRERELYRHAFYDELTGLPNRKLFGDRAGHAVGLARRSGTTAAVVYADLDDFKAVNDTMGHAAGDALLAAAARRITGALRRDSDTTARLGGDEFAAVMENLPGPGAAGKLAERVVQAFAEPFPLAAGHAAVGITVGIATTRDSDDLATLLEYADQALYQAKAGGKNSWRAYQRKSPARQAEPESAARAARISAPGFPPGIERGTAARAGDASQGGRPPAAGTEARRSPRAR